MNLRGFSRNRLLSSFLSLLCLSAFALGTPLNDVNGTRDGPDRLPHRFCVTLSCTRGVIQITYSETGSVLGYISNTYPNYPNQGTEYYLATPTINDALIVYLPSTNVLSDLRLNSFNIYAANPANSDWHYLGAEASIGGLNLEDAPNLALITGTKVIPVGPPQPDPAVQEISDSSFWGESQIWFLGCLHQFFSKWVNQDGTTSEPNYFYLPPGIGNPVGLLGMAVNIAAVSPQAAPVTFSFVPQCTCPRRCIRRRGCIC